MLNTHFLTRGALKFTWDVQDSDMSENKKIPALFANNSRLTFVLSKHQPSSESQKSNTELRNRLYQTAKDAQFRCQENRTFLQRDGTPVVETITFLKDPEKNQQVRPAGGKDDID